MTRPGAASSSSGGPDELGSRRGRTAGLLAAFLAVSSAAGVIGAGVVVPALAGVGGTAADVVSVYDRLPADLGDQSLPQATRILYADGSLMATVYDQDRTDVSFDQIAPVMREAIVSIEDSRFYSHGPVDLRGVARALVSNAGGGDTQGASTLTQQYVKNVLVQQAVDRGDSAGAAAATTASGIAGYARKLRELKLAVGVEQTMSKDDILTGYLNVAYFDNGAYGIEAASRFYFDESAQDLTLPQAALLAGLVQNPVADNPLKNPAAATARRTVVLDRMLSLGRITQEQHDAAVAAPLGLDVQRPQQGCASAGSAAYFCDYVVRLVETDPVFGASAQARARLLRRGGLTIRTTLDPQVQATTQQAVDEGVAPGQTVRMAASVVQPGTGRILAMAQDTTFSADTRQAGATQVNYDVDSAYGGGNGFQTGSAFKAFTLAQWLEAGNSLDSTIDAPQVGDDPFSAFTACGVRSRDTAVYRYQNAESSDAGVMSVRQATAQSVNTAYVAMEKRLDLCDIAATAQSMGVHLANPDNGTVPEQKAHDLSDVDDGDGGRNTDLYVSPSLTLGVNEIAPLTMAAAYATFAADGTYCDPVAITGVTSSAGKPLAVPQSSCRQVLAPDVARGVTDALQSVVTDGTGTGARIDRPAAGKTGTTNDSTDAWFVGYTPQLAAAVWMGHADGTSSMTEDSINGAPRRTIFGGTIAAPTWAAIVGPASDELHLPTASFPPPTGSAG